MAKFKIGDRARLKHAYVFPHRIGKECTIIAIGQFTTIQGNIRDCIIEYDDGWMPDGMRFAVDFDQLEPIIDLGSWDEIQKAINWNLQRRLVIMTRDEWKKYLPLIQSFVEGKELQCIDKNNNQDSWRSVNSPSFDFDSYEYRIKPEPKVIWCNEYEDEIFSYESKDEAVKNGQGTPIPMRLAVKYIESIND